MTQGIVKVLDFESQILQGNSLRDPALRKLWVYLPKGFESGAANEIPALLALNGFTSNGGMFFSGTPLSEDLKTRLDRLIDTGACPPCIVVAPDCFTRFGGSQYINSSATGRYQDYLVKEIVPFINRTFSPKRWGVFGKSSGGFGSMILAMEYPEIFQALANHSGDSNFELAYLADFRKALDQFKKAGGPEKWIEAFWNEAHPENRKDIDTLDKLAMSACYSPNPESQTLGIDFPFDLETGVFKPQVWQKWRAWDPVNRISSHEASLKKLRFIYIDCGTKDEFALHWGCRALAAELKKIGVGVHYEEFNDSHMAVSYRLDKSLPLLVKALR